MRRGGALGRVSSKPGAGCQSVRHHAAHPEGLGRRLAELDREWDIEPTFEANAASLTLAGVALAVTIDRRWLALPAVVTAFLLHHAVQGWCPPLSLPRWLGFRTMRDVEAERSALKALRGAFGPLSPGERDRDDRASHALQAATR